MSYNGIGLATARGSGTNGFIQRNLSYVKTKVIHKNPTYFQEPEQRRKPNQEIILHDKKRKVEIKCLELEDELTEAGIDEDEIETRVQELREELLADLDKMTENLKAMKKYQTHQLAQAKEVMNQKLANAFGISNEYQEGAAFEKDYHIKKREEKRLEWEQRREERKRRHEEWRQRQNARSKEPSEHSPIRGRSSSPNYRSRTASKEPVRRTRSRSPSHSPEYERNTRDYSPDSKREYSPGSKRDYSPDYKRSPRNQVLRRQDSPSGDVRPSDLYVASERRRGRSPSASPSPIRKRFVRSSRSPSERGYSQSPSYRNNSSRRSDRSLERRRYSPSPERTRKRYSESPRSRFVQSRHSRGSSRSSNLSDKE